MISKAQRRVAYYIIFSGLTLYMFLRCRRRRFHAPAYQSDVPSTAYPPHGPNGDQFSNLPWTRTLVAARLSEEDTAWIGLFLNDEPLFTRVIYTVDDPSASLSVPKNKGNEAMVYLTYIIHNYHNLSDITLFMHYHQVAWHNNDLLDLNAVETVRHLKSDKVMRDGYFNLRCHHNPGCPDHIHPTTDSDDTLNIPEAVVIGKAWLELFPDAKALPKVLSQPCCSQFAVSKQRIRALPLDRYRHFRDWLLNTELDDVLSGRVWEYTWQYIFGGVEELCPAEHICYCDGYGICFGGKEQYEEWFDLRDQKRILQKELDANGEIDEVALMVQIGRLALDMQNKKNAAFERGRHPRNRALEAGRTWTSGEDG